VVKVLLAAGAEVNARTKKSETALSAAATHPEVRSILLQAGAKN
jgi:ankyrin repeat protein